VNEIVIGFIFACAVFLLGFLLFIRNEA